MGFLMRWITRAVALGTAGLLVYWTWRIWKGNDLELAALFFGAVAVLRSVLLAFLRRHDDVSGLFRTNATAFIKNPLEEFAFIAPIYAAPAVWSQFGFLWVAASIPAGWIVLRGIVRMILRKSAGEVEG